jgi:histone acetyltransferase
MTVDVLHRSEGPKQEERDGVIRFKVIHNDGSSENLVLITCLKSIFQKQLPKMPKEYIARLIYDKNHYSMMILKSPGDVVVAGITYRLFLESNFAEIVFCAVTATEQVRGYGSFMMNYLKEHVKTLGDVRYFLTYADNYAVGYFKKQGFSKYITLDKSIWAGKIKDYDGGTLMECRMVRKVNYRELYQILTLQRQAIYEKLKEKSQYHVVHPGLKGPMPIENIPGVLEAGWTIDMVRSKRSKPDQSSIYEILRPILTDLQNHAAAWPFAEPVNAEDVPDYHKVIRTPMDLKTMDTKLESNLYPDMESFVHDVELMIRNCKTYNQEHTVYHKCALSLDEYFQRRLKSKRI